MLIDPDTQLNLRSYYEASVVRPPPAPALQGDPMADVRVGGAGGGRPCAGRGRGTGGARHCAPHHASRDRHGQHCAAGPDPVPAADSLQCGSMRHQFCAGLLSIQRRPSPVVRWPGELHHAHPSATGAVDGGAPAASFPAARHCADRACLGGFVDISMNRAASNISLGAGAFIAPRLTDCRLPHCFEDNTT